MSQVRGGHAIESYKNNRSSLNNPESFSHEDVQMIVSSEPIQKLMTSDKVKEMLPEGVDLVQIRDVVSSDSFKVMMALSKVQGLEFGSGSLGSSKGDKLTIDDAKAFLKSEPVQMLLKSNIVADHLPKNVNLSTVAKLMNSDVAKVIIPLLKDPKSFDSDDAKMLLNSKPMQMFFNSDQMNSMLPAGLTFADLKQFGTSENFEMMKSLVKDPSSLSAEDVKAVVNSKPFQNV